MSARVTIAVVRDLDRRADRVDEAVSAALAPLDLAGLVRGRYVAVKPNETWATAEDTTGVTQGDTLDAVLGTQVAYGQALTFEHA